MSYSVSAYETLRASGQCEKGMAMPMEPGTDCEDKDKCEGTCGNQLVVAGTIIQICCMGKLITVKFRNFRTQEALL